MSQKLRELIRSVRACKTAAEERAVISKECALIRTAFVTVKHKSLSFLIKCKERCILFILLLLLVSGFLLGVIALLCLRLRLGLWWHTLIRRRGRGNEL